MNLYTVPDFFQLRYGGQWPRRLAALATILCSFTYVVAQIYGVGLISSRLTGVQFEIGVLLGLGGVLVCSFLGGMRAITWTQAAQYVVMILAFLIPASWLAYKQLGNPLAPWVYGQQIAQVTQLEQRIINSPSEQQVIEVYARRAKDYEHKLQNVQRSLDAERLLLKERLRLLNEERADAETVFEARRAIANLPKDAEQARTVWSQAMQDNLQRAKPLGGMPLQATPFAGDPHGTPEQRELFDVSRRNFIALVFCLMVGTMGLPHLLTRFFTTSSQAETRRSVVWSLFFITLLYISAPAIAVMVKFEVMSSLVGKSFDDLAPWMVQWAKVDPTLLSLQDVNGDQHLQFSELRLGPDLIMLAMPEIGGLPYVISGLVAAGGLAAALSTADGLLLTIGNALAHDLYFRGATGHPQPGQSARSYDMKRVIASKFALLLVALTAAYVAAQKPADILYLVSASFSLAGAAFVPAMVLGIFWRRTTAAGALCGMLVGMGVTLYYMVINASWLREALKWSGSGLWWGIQPISAGVFGVAAGAGVMLVVSLLTRGRGLITAQAEQVARAPQIHL
jgi:cation/acetate symporter